MKIIICLSFIFSLPKVFFMGLCFLIFVISVGCNLIYLLSKIVSPSLVLGLENKHFINEIL